jgi:hypothetical protein
MPTPVRFPQARRPLLVAAVISSGGNTIVKFGAKNRLLYGPCVTIDPLQNYFQKTVNPGLSRSGKAE